MGTAEPSPGSERPSLPLQPSPLHLGRWVLRAGLLARQTLVSTCPDPPLNPCAGQCGDTAPVALTWHLTEMTQSGLCPDWGGGGLTTSQGWTRGHPGLLPPSSASLPWGLCRQCTQHTPQRLFQKLPGRKLVSWAPALRAVWGPRAQLWATSLAPLQSCQAWQSRTPGSSRTKAARPIRMRFCTV